MTAGGKLHQGASIMEILSPRPGWLLPLLVTSLVFGGAVSRPSGEPAVCGRSCCSVLPSCRTARTVDCNCPEVEKMVLRAGDIPSTVRSVTIHHTAHVIVEKNAIGGLNSLENFTLSDIGGLNLNRSSMVLRSQPKLHLVQFKAIGSVQVEPFAFSGTWRSHTTIEMQHIDYLHVMSNAFHYDSDSAGPSLSIQHVPSLRVEPNGLSAPLYQVALTDVSMTACCGGSFGGHTAFTDWTNVTVHDMKENCFHGVNDSATLTLTSLRAENVHPSAISGTVRDFIIEKSSFGTVHEKGINITATTMELTKSSIVDLHRKGLHVFASESFKVNMIRIDRLRKDAFLGIKVSQNADGRAPWLKIRKMEVIESEPGSLKFSQCTNVQMSDVDLVAPWPQICPTEKWTRVMSGSGTERPLTQPQYELFRQLQRRHLCPEEDRRAGLPVTAESSRCQRRGLETDNGAVFVDPEGHASSRAENDSFYHDAIGESGGNSDAFGQDEQGKTVTLDEGTDDTSGDTPGRDRDVEVDLEHTGTLGRNGCQNGACGETEENAIIKHMLGVSDEMIQVDNIQRKEETILQNAKASEDAVQVSVDGGPSSQDDTIFYVILGVSMALLVILTAALVLVCMKILNWA